MEPQFAQADCSCCVQVLSGKQMKPFVSPQIPSEHFETLQISSLKNISSVCWYGKWTLLWNDRTAIQVQHIYIYSILPEDMLTF